MALPSRKFWEGVRFGILVGILLLLLGVVTFLAILE